MHRDPRPPGDRARAAQRPPPRVALRDEPLRLLTQAMLAESGAGPTTRLFQEGAAQALVARLFALDARESPETPRHGLSPRALGHVLEYLDAHLAEDISVGDLASVAGVKATWARHMQKLLGATPGTVARAAPRKSSER